MVGRSAINHPCSFAQVDSILWNAQTNKPSRQQVVQTYIEYCEEQEAQMRAAFPGRSDGEVQDFRRKLIAVPFHLFMGEDGNNAYQRRLRKLSSRGHRHSAASMLGAAMRELPTETLEKSVEEYTPWDDIEKFDFTKRAGSMQRTIY
jgi:tRNA-dihydrouridine synthase